MRRLTRNRSANIVGFANDWTHERHSWAAVAASSLLRRRTYSYGSVRRWGRKWKMEGVVWKWRKKKMMMWDCGGEIWKVYTCKSWILNRWLGFKRNEMKGWDWNTYFITFIIYNFKKERKNVCILIYMLFGLGRANPNFYMVNPRHDPTWSGWNFFNPTYPNQLGCIRRVVRFFEHL